MIYAFYVFDERLKLTGLMTQLATLDLGSLQGQPLWYDISCAVMFLALSKLMLPS